MTRRSTEVQSVKKTKCKATLRGNVEIQDAYTRRRKLLLAPLLVPGLHDDHITHRDNNHNKEYHHDSRHVYSTRHPISLSHSLQPPGGPPAVHSAKGHNASWEGLVSGTQHGDASCPPTRQKRRKTALTRMSHHDHCQVDNHSTGINQNTYSDKLGYAVDCMELSDEYQHIKWVGQRYAIAFNHRMEATHAHFHPHFHSSYGYVWALYVNGINLGTHSSPIAFVSRQTIDHITHLDALEDKSMSKKWRKNHAPIDAITLHSHHFPHPSCDHSFMHQVGHSPIVDISTTDHRPMEDADKHKNKRKRTNPLTTTRQDSATQDADPTTPAQRYSPQSQDVGNVDNLRPWEGDLKVASWNGQSIFCDSQIKRTRKHCRIATLRKSNDVVLIQETYGTRGCEPSYRCPPRTKVWWSHSTIRSNRAGAHTSGGDHEKRKGGIATLVSEEFLSNFDVINWHEIILGRVAVLRLSGTLGALDIWMSTCLPVMNPAAWTHFAASLSTCANLIKYSP